MDDPNMHAYGEAGPDDAEIGRQWREDSSLKTWFPLTAERLAALETENAALKRDLQYARDGLTKGRSRMREDNERLRGEAGVLRAWINAALVPLQSIVDLEDFEDGGEGMQALIDAGRALLGPNVEFSGGPLDVSTTKDGRGPSARTQG